MALVTVGSTPQDIDDIAAQAKELDEQIKDYTRDIQQLDREIGDTQKEKGLLETALMLSELQKNKLKVVDRLNAAKPDPEVAAKLQDLRNQLKLQQKKVKLTEQAKQTTLAQYEKKSLRLEELLASLDETKAKTNWAQVSKGHHGNRDFMGQENRLREMKASIKLLESEQQVQKQVLQKKTQLIEKLLKRQGELDEAEHNLDELKLQIKDAEAERENQADELRTLSRIFHKKESLIKNLQRDTDVNDPATIKRLESDKKVLQYEITKHAGSRRSNDKTIQAQHYRLRALEQKLSAIAVALKSLKRKEIDEEEIMKYRPGVEDIAVADIDATLFSAAQRELEDARRSIEAKDTLMLQKDVTVEVLEKKVEILVNAKEGLIRRLKRESAEKEREKRTIQGSIEHEEDVHFYTKERLVKEKKHYDDKLQKHRGRASA